MKEEEKKPRTYKVTLTNGDYGFFTNDNYFDDYESRLVSGLYSITTASNYTQITPETVMSIEEIETPTEDN